jgi:hypothetical protein
MHLTDIVPLDQIQRVLGAKLRVRHLATSDWRKFLPIDRDALFGMAASAWHRLVESGSPKVDPMAMRSYFQAWDPHLAEAMEGVIGRPLLKELGFCEATLEHSGAPFVVATSCVAQLYSDELHLGDIGLADPSRPLTRSKQKSPSHGFHGFGLLSTVMANLFEAASERGCRSITLTAAHRPLVRVFERYGFAVENNDFGKRALRSGISIPMESPVP